MSNKPYHLGSVLCNQFFDFDIQTFVVQSFWLLFIILVSSYQHLLMGYPGRAPPGSLDVLYCSLLLDLFDMYSMVLLFEADLFDFEICLIVRYEV